MSLFNEEYDRSMALQWTFGSVAVATTCGRFFLRWYYYKALRYDDLFNGIALLSLLTNLIILDLLNWSDSVENDGATPYKLQLAENLSLWMTLYSVKASFLALIWSIFRISTNFRRLWWAVAVYTFITFWMIFFSEFWQCGSPADYADPQACNGDEIPLTQRPYIVVPMWFKCVFHISSDILILVLPLVYIKRLNIPTSKKAATIATFAVVLVDIAMGFVKQIAIIRTNLYGDSPDDGFDYGIYLVFSYLEPTLAVIVCAFPVYRVLLPSSRRRQSDQAELRANAAAIGDRKAVATHSTATTEGSAIHMQEPKTAYVI